MKRTIAITICAFISISALVAQESDELLSDESSLIIQAETAAESNVAERIGVFTTWDFIRMILILAAVIAAIYGIFYLLKRSGNPKLAENRLIRVLSSKSITQGKTLHLIEVGNQVFLVGAAESSVSLLSEIGDKETLDGIHLQASNVESDDRRSFGETLSQMFGRERPRDLPADPVGYIQQQRQRVKQM